MIKPSSHLMKRNSSITRLTRTVEIIERFTAFHNYSRSTSWLRVAFVCLKAFAPSFGVTVLLMVMPLAPPSEGWSQNWMFWLHTFLGTVCVSFGVAIQFQMIVPDAALKMKHLLFVALLASSGFAFELILVASRWVFPLPFTLLLGVPGWQSSLIAGMVLTTGIKNLKAEKELRKQCEVMYIVISIQSTLILVYPVYNAVFLALKGDTQTMFIVVLPIIKFCMKRVLARTIGHSDSGMVLVMTSVELFDVLYLFKCMQVAGSRMSGMLLISVDLAINMFHLWHRRGRVVMANMAADDQTVKTDVKDLIQIAIHAANRSLGSIISEKGPIMASSRNPILSVHVKSRISASVLPVDSSMTSARVLGQSVQMLIIECENIMVVEFIECMVPMFYVISIAILFFLLPNVQYYPELGRMTSNQFIASVSNIAAFSAMEIVSLLYVHAMLQWRFGISALHLLAFMLERQNWLLQGVFLTWVPMIMQYTLEHNG